MDIDITQIVNSIKLFYHREAMILLLLVMLSLIAIVASIFGFKNYFQKSVIKAILIIFSTCVCALSLIIIKIIEFAPVYDDYKNMTYTIEQNAEIYIVEGTNNLWEQKNLVQLKTQNGEEIELEITNDYKFETGVILEGTVVYTNHSKHIVWYKF